MKQILLTTRNVLWESRWTTLAVIIVAVSMGAILAGFFPGIKENSAEVTQFVESFPILEYLGYDTFDLTKVDSFMAAEYFSLSWAFIFLPFVIAWGVRLAGQAQEGRLAVILSYPVSRGQLIISHLLSMAAGTLAMAIAIVGGALVSVYVFTEESVNVGNWLLFLLFFWLVLWSLGNVTMTLSVVTMQRNRTIMMASLLIVGSFFFNVFARLNEDLEFLQDLSWVHYYGEPGQALLKGTLPDSGWLFFSAVIIFTLVASILIFRRKNIEVG